MKENKKVNELKQYMKEHKLENAIGIAGLTIGVITGAGLMYLGFRHPIKLNKYIKMGTRSTEVFEPNIGVVKTVAELFGDSWDVFHEACPYVQPDDTIANFIINVAKKA